MKVRDFPSEFLRELKRTAVEPVFSMGEVVAIIALIALKPPSWVMGPIFFCWIVWKRRSRNPKLEAPKRFVRTVKQPGDLVL